MGCSQSGQIPNSASLSVGMRLWGCGGCSFGGGTAGPRGEAERARAGEEGENHHSRNLMKKIAVGRRTLSASRRSRGEVNSRRRTRCNRFRRICDVPFLLAARLARRCGYDHQPILTTREKKLPTRSSKPRRRRSTPIQANHGRWKGVRSNKYRIL
jgi:hypothetical protein